jgi:hypothetical protein
MWSRAIGWATAEAQIVFASRNRSDYARTYIPGVMIGVDRLLCVELADAHWILPITSEIGRSGVRSASTTRTMSGPNPDIRCDPLLYDGQTALLWLRSRLAV